MRPAIRDVSARAAITASTALMDRQLFAVRAVEIGVAIPHQGGKSSFVVGLDGAQPFFECLPQPFSGLRCESVERLNFEVEARVLGCHLERRPELFGECDAGDLTEIGGTDR